MPDSKNARLLSNKRDDIHSADYDNGDARAILSFLNAYNPNSLTIKPPIKQSKDKREDTLSTSSRLAYSSTLHRTAEWLDADNKTLLNARARDLNEIAQARLNGTHASVDSSGVTQNTVHQNQIAWRSFYQFHRHHPDGAAVSLDPVGIVLADRDTDSVDERDMFSPDEIQAMRDACQNKRDRAVLELLIYTGQRHNALRMLCVRDIRPAEGESGMLYLPDIDEGLKGADGKRPLLGAQKACEEWLAAHPTGEPDHAFITHVYEWSNHDTIEPGDHLSRGTFGRISKRVAKRAGVDKRAHPHQFRHYFVTMAVKEHGMSFDTVRHLIGHAESSRELERTYQHLVDDDYIENAELDMGIREERDESLTPSQCFTCNEPLQPSHTYCPNCGRAYGPDADQLEDEIETTTTDAAFNADDKTEKAAVRQFIDGLKNNPELKNQLLAAVEESDADSLEEAGDRLSR